MHHLILDPTWKPTAAHPDETLPVETFKFHGGEIHLKLGVYRSAHQVQPWDICVYHRIRGGDDLQLVLLAADALRERYWNAPLYVCVPYLPFARQDRRMVAGEPFSLRTIVNQLSLIGGFQEVQVLDPHNAEVTAALFEQTKTRLRLIEPAWLRQAAADIKLAFGEYVLVAPDAGASKKIAAAAEYIGYHGEILQGSKHRDVATGRIVHYDVNATEAEIGGRTCWIMDDICSKGGTFKLLAKRLKELGAARVVLSVSHWEEVADLGDLFDAGISGIFTTNSLGDATPHGMLRQYQL